MHQPGGARKSINIMVYKKKCVVSLIANDRPLREHFNEQTKEDEVYLAFGSEYKIRVNNRNNFNRIAVRVYIDGTDVLGGSHLIVNANSSIDLERFLGNDNDSGKRFKFVSVNDSKVNDPESSDNGLVTVDFYEVEEPYTIIWSSNDLYMWPPNVDNISYSCCRSAVPSADVGATVEGTVSNQSFTNVDVDIKPNAFCSLSLRMKGVNKGDLLTKRYCSSCGYKLQTKYNYCPSCGQEI